LEPSSFGLVKAALCAAPRVVRDADAQAMQKILAPPVTQTMLATQVTQVRQRPQQARAVLVSSLH